MRIRYAATVTAVLTITLTACSSDDIPAVPTGSERSALIAALKDVNPAIVTDEDKAIDAARDQCATLNEVRRVRHESQGPVLHQRPRSH
ncbi:hypothetical protein ACFYO0_45030 [Streptomyces sp. NPDC006365]|uniref:hypothetical protein n=1 Tax=Streptomyces sp. NPDC006365 TaxID=3364744 RepID=UPI0036AC6B23